MTTKKKNRFYNFTMLKVIPDVLKRFLKLEVDEKWHWERREFYMWYVHRVRIAWYERDWIGVITFSIICKFLKGKIK